MPGTRATLSAIGLCVLLVLTGCGRCGSSGAALTETQLLERLPADASAIAVVPSPATLGEALQRLQRVKAASFVAQLQGFGNASEYADAAASQLGLDPRAPQSLSEAGLDPRAPAAMVLLDDERAFGLVQLSDPSRFEAAIAIWARQKLGAAEVSRSQSGDIRLMAFSRTAGGPAELAVARNGSLAWAARGKGALELVQSTAASATAKTSSLGESAGFKERLRRLPSERQLWVYLPPSGALAQRLKVSPLAALRVVPGETDAALEVVTYLPPSAVSGEDDATRVDVTHLIPGDAFLVARLGGDTAGLRTVWREALGAREVQRLSEAGFDVEKEVFANLKPGSWAALALAPGVRLVGGMPTLDVRRSNPFRFVQLTGVATPKDPAKSQETLKRLPSLAPLLQARIEPKTLAGQEAFFTTYAQGEGIHFAQVKGEVLFGAPGSALEALIQQQVGGGEPKGPQRLWRVPGEPRESAVALDLQRLSRSVRALPSEAWGVGGFAIRASALKWLDAVSDLTAVEALLYSTPTARRVTFRLRFAQL